MDMDSSRSSADTRTKSIYVYDVREEEEAAAAAAACIHAAVPLPPPTTTEEEIHLVMDERMAKTTAALEADFSKVETKIHRFPRGLQAIGGDDDDDGRYIVPSVVAIGPYHHDAPHLRKMEEVKLAAAYYLCRDAGRSTAEVFDKVRAVAGAARDCYDADDPSVRRLGDAELAAMMFLDGCFLLQYMVGDSAPAVLRNRMVLSTGICIQKDIFLLENQIPWLVLDVLTEFMPVNVEKFVAGIGERFLPGPAERKPKKFWRRRMRRSTDDDRSRGCGGGGGVSLTKSPPHLLGLLWLTQVGCIPEDKRIYAGISLSLSSSAVELAEMGVNLAPSTAAWFGDMRVRRKPCLTGELCLSPLFLNDVTACWLVNIAALEASNSGSGTSRDKDNSDDGYVLSSYLSVLAMLMDGEEAVQQLRAKHVLYSTFSNKQALRFFKRLAQHLRFGNRYFLLLEDIEAYQRKRSVIITVHRLLYSSFKAMTIATLFSIVGVLVGIFKTLLDNRKIKH